MCSPSSSPEEGEAQASPSPTTTSLSRFTVTIASAPFPFWKIAGSCNHNPRALAGRQHDPNPFPPHASTPGQCLDNASLPRPLAAFPEADLGTRPRFSIHFFGLGEFLLQASNKYPIHLCNMSLPTPSQAPERVEQVEKPQKANIVHSLGLGNGHKPVPEEPEFESELSEPDSTLHSPPAPITSITAEDEIVVGARSNGVGKSPSRRAIDQDEEMGEAADAAMSPYPKRKRNLTHSDLSDSRVETPITPVEDKVQVIAPLKAKPGRPAVKGVTLGIWRESPVPDDDFKHIVIGFIDVRDRLRTRIQPNPRASDGMGQRFPLPPGPGGSWVTFEKIIFLPHLVGLDQQQVKEFVRIRFEAAEDGSAGDEAAERSIVQEAIRRCKERPASENPTVAPVIAYGPELPPGAMSTPARPDKRRKTSNGYAVMHPSPAGSVAPEPIQHQQTLQSTPSRGVVLDPLHGTRPTRILLGYWKGSSEPDPKNRHAVFGILGQNDMFRVKLVRESRDGRFVDGNFPTGAGALWIQWEEVEFEPHLKDLQRSEIKEYCRVRQWQIDHGEIPEQRLVDEKTAVDEARARAVQGALRPANHPIAPAPAPAPIVVEDGDANHGYYSNRFGHGAAVPAEDHRPSRRSDARPDSRLARQGPPENEPRTASRPPNPEALERANNLARREIARVEAAQGRADRHAVHRERAVAAAAADAANVAAAAAAAAAAAPTPVQPHTNGRMRFHETDELQRLNKVWARQETMRIQAGLEDAKIYDGIKYERKPTGPFMGKLVSQGTIINIDGEDYVEYRVLTKPSFF
jgi:hypothetical protein